MGTSEAKTFFRSCPSCGRRFEIRLESKREPGEDTKTTTLLRGANLGRGGMLHTVLEENVPILVTDREFQYAYKCKHCGHEWSEFHEERTEKRGRGYEGYRAD